jgi:hypothetical protein
LIVVEAGGVFMTAYDGLRRRAGITTTFIALAGAAFMPSVAAKTDGPFSGVLGVWKGAGQLTLDGGRSESLKCRAYYTERNGGSGLGLAIRCASASNNIELRAGLVSAGGRLTGTWEERVFNVGGDVSGQVNGGKINLAINGGSFTASMAVSTSGTSQSVSITAQGTAMRGVTINFSRD